MTVPAAIARLVVARAADRCEYCRMHRALQGAAFHVEHIRPRSRGGTSDAANLALACPGCNLHKADRIDAVDPVSSAVVPLFDPRTNPWPTHFRFDDAVLFGLTPVGRATVQLLRLNDRRRQLIRHAEAMFGLFPPDPA